MHYFETYLVIPATYTELATDAVVGGTIIFAFAVLRRDKYREMHYVGMYKSTGITVCLCSVIVAW